MNINRRQMMGAATGLAAALAVGTGGCQEEIARMAKKKSFLNCASDHYYNPDGSFSPDKARDACFEMMRYYNYPIPNVLKTDAFWVCDFLQRDYGKLGMGGIFWINAKGTYAQAGAKAYKGDFQAADYGYLGHEIFLLPAQMIPEHRHVGGSEGYGPKMESWQVRYGEVEFFGEYKGAGDETPISDMPQKDRPWGCGEPWFKSKYVVKRTSKSGELYTLEDPESWHFQRAGAAGAIVTEYGTYHNQVEFSKPAMEFDSSRAG